MPDYLVSVRKAVVQTASLLVKARSLNDAGRKAMGIVAGEDFGTPKTEISSAGAQSYSPIFDGRITPDTPLKYIETRSLYHSDPVQRSLAGRLRARILGNHGLWDDKSRKLAEQLNERLIWTDARPRKPRPSDNAQQSRR